MLNLIVMQMSKGNREKGYYTSQDNRAYIKKKMFEWGVKQQRPWERGWELKLLDLSKIAWATAKKCKKVQRFFICHATLQPACDQKLQVVSLRPLHVYQNITSSKIA